MIDTRFNLLPTMIGSLPHRDAQAACRLVARYLPEIPAWPQLPKLSVDEGMAQQCATGLPGLVVFEGKLTVRDGENQLPEMEKLYSAFLENDADAFPILPGNAAGLQLFTRSDWPQAQAVKGQLCGPLTLGLSVTDAEETGVIYDPVLADAVCKLVRLKAAWMEKTLGQINSRTLIWLDEPSMHAYGSAFFNISRELIICSLNEAMGGLTGLKGVHGCGNTDWPMLLETNLDVISFDAYNYAESLALYPQAVKDFLQRGGAIAWGIVPNDEGALAYESVSSLTDRLNEAMAPFTRHGIGIEFLREHGLLTPSCGLAGLSEQAAERVLELLAELSKSMRRLT